LNTGTGDLWFGIRGNWEAGFTPEDEQFPHATIDTGFEVYIVGTLRKLVGGVADIITDPNDFIYTVPTNYVAWGS
jgi:hypothetical protein